MKDSQEITAGDYSSNIQGTKVNVYQQGLNYTEVKDIVMTVFKSNFYDLGKEVEKIVDKRAEEIVTEYLQRLVAKSPEALRNTEDPDLRFAIYEVQKSHARRGEKKVADLLVDVLVDRTLAKEESLLKLVYNEAMEIIPKLTLKQIDVVTAIFIARYVNIGGLFPIELLNAILNNFVSDVPEDEIFYRHLEYTGCISISIGSLEFTGILSEAYPNLVPVDSELTFEENLQTVAPQLHAFSKKWEETKLCNSTLTSVGIAIGLSNLKRKIGVDWDLGIWIKG